MTRQEVEAENESITARIADITKQINALSIERNDLNDQKLANMVEINRQLRAELERG